SVRRKTHAPYVCAWRNDNFLFRPIGNGLQCDCSNTAAALLTPVRFRIDARTGDSVDWLRQFSNRGHASPIEQRNRAMVRRDDDRRRRGCVEHVDYDFRWRQVTSSSGLLPSLCVQYSRRADDERSGDGELSHPHVNLLFSTVLELSVNGAYSISRRCV